MSPVQQLRTRREQVWQRLNDLATKAASENRAFSDFEQTKYEADTAELDQIDERIGELVEQQQRVQHADDVFRELAGGADDTELPAFVRGYAPLASTGHRGWLPSWRRYQSEQRDLAEAGSPFVPAEQSSRWFDMLRAQSVVLQAGPVQFPMQSQTLVVPKVTGAATAQMLAEGASIPEADPSLGSSTLTARKATLFNLVNNELLDDSQPRLQEVLSAALARDMATLVDKQLLTGNGTAPNVRGMINFSGATAVSNGANGLQLSTQTNLDAFAGPVGTLQSLNSDLSNAAWFISPVLWSFVRRIKDGQNRYQLLPQGNSPTSDSVLSLFGIPVYISSNLPSAQTVGTSTDCSTCVLADMSQIAVGMRRDIGLEMSRDYAFQSDKTALRLISRFDIQPINAAATVVITGLRAA